MLRFLCLYAALASPEWSEREAATSALTHLIDRHPATYGPRLAEWTRDASCPETRSRASRILAGYHRWRVNSFVPSSVPVWPCCDYYPAANPLVPFGLAPDVRDVAAAWSWYGCGSHFRDVPNMIGSGPFWHHHRAGTERMIRDMLRTGSTAEECDRLLSRMWALECSYRGHCTPERWAVSRTWLAWQGGYPMPDAAPIPAR